MTIFMRNAVIGALLAYAGVTSAKAEDAWVATHNLVPGDILRSDDLETRPLTAATPDALPASRQLIGLEVKRRIYLGRAIGARDVGAPLAVKANMPVEVHWQSGSLTLVMQGSAMDPGAIGEQVRVLNTTTSRAVRGTVIGDGIVEVRSEP